MLKRIMAPVDGSKRAERGLEVAARLARGSGSELLLARIVSVPYVRFAPYGEPAQIALAVIANAREDVEEYLKRVSESALVEDIAVQTRAVEGHVTADILDLARDEKCDLIVISTHGYTGFNRWRLGRVANHVARHSPVPVLIVPSQDSDETHAIAGEGLRILITLDGSELAEASLAPALEIAHALAEPEQITVHLMEVVDVFAAIMAEADDDDAKTPADSKPYAGGTENQALDAARGYLDTVSQKVRQENPGVTVTSAARLATDVAQTICDTAEEKPPFDFIAMATHGRGGLQRWALGSITERVLHATHLPLLIARSPVDIARENEAAETDANLEPQR